MDLLLHLRGFVAVADELSVSEAAVELGVDQPLLSRRLRTLERELGVQLFDRSRRRIALTPDGADLLPRARQLVEQAGHLVRSVRSADRTSVTLALPPEPDPAPLAELLGLLAEQGVTVRLATADGTAPDSAAWVVDPSDPASATWLTELGAASAPGGCEATGLGAASTPDGSEITGLSAMSAPGRSAIAELGAASASGGSAVTGLGAASASGGSAVTGLGAASASGGSAVTGLGAASPAGGSVRPIRLGHLRPRRGAGGPPVLVLPQDLVPPRGDALRAAADRAGLSPGALRPCPPGLAVAEVLAGRARLICGAYEARLHGLAWAPFTDPLVRGHRLTELAPLPDVLSQGPVRRRALRLLGTALGAERVERR